jgi:DNA-binding NarL/FixJ family response regulator
MKILLAEDHPLFREGLRRILEQDVAGSVVIECETLAATLAALRDDPDVDLLILDMQLSDSSGLDGFLALREKFPILPTLIISASEEGDIIRSALAMGASGYLPKSAAPQTFRAALKLVLSGEIYVPVVLATAGLQQRKGRQSIGLTPRETQVLELLARDRTNSEIAAELGVAENTVRVHVVNILRNLKAHNRSEAVRIAIDLNLIEGRSASA